VAPGAAVEPAAAEEATDTKPENSAAEKKPEEPLSEGEKAALAAAKGEEADDDSAESKDSARSTRKSRSRSKSRSSDDPAPSAPKRTASTSPSESSAPAKPTRSSGKESIDDLLAGALGGGSKKPVRKAASEPSAAKSNLPRTPSRDDVLKALRGVQPAVSACAQGQRGVAMADITVGNSGRVKSVRVTQVTGPVASCIARAVRRAKFPRFSDPKFSVKFPFRL
jgi:hypothetical protein